MNAAISGDFLVEWQRGRVCGAQLAFLSRRDYHCASAGSSVSHIAARDMRGTA